MKSRHFSSDEVREPQVSVGAVRGWEPTGLPTSRLCSETAGRGQGILLSQRKGQEEGTKPQAPGPTAHRGSKGRMCLKKKKKKIHLPLSQRQRKKGNGGGPVPITMTITTSRFCNCQNKKKKKERSGSLLSICSTLHESGTGPP